MDRTLIGPVNGAMGRWLATLGFPGVAGIGIFVFCLVFYLSGLQPKIDRIATLKDQTEQLHRRQGDVSKRSVPPGPSEQLDAFYGFFPRLVQAPETLLKIFQAAERQGINLEQGEYKLVADPELKLLRYQASLPVKGSYLQIRNFLSEALNAVPSASLEYLSIKKEQVGDGNIEARVRFTLFLRSE